VWPPYPGAGQGGYWARRAGFSLSFQPARPAGRYWAPASLQTAAKEGEAVQQLVDQEGPDLDMKAEDGTLYRFSVEEGIFSPIAQ
jgi:hypothetical protein